MHCLPTGSHQEAATADAHGGRVGGKGAAEGLEGRHRRRLRVGEGASCPGDLDLRRPTDVRTGPRIAECHGRSTILPRDGRADLPQPVAPQSGNQRPTSSVIALIQFRGRRTFLWCRPSWSPGPPKMQPLTITHQR